MNHSIHHHTSVRLFPEFFSWSLWPLLLVSRRLSLPEVAELLENTPTRKLEPYNLLKSNS